MDLNSSHREGNNCSTANSLSTNVNELPNFFQLVLGGFYIILALIGFVSNLFVGRTIHRKKSKVNSSSILIPCLGCIALFLSCIIPLNAASAFNKEFRLGVRGCQWYTFSLTSSGLTFITLLVVIVVQVYRIIVKNSIPNKGYNWISTLKIVACCVFTCCGLSALPLFGISEYEETLRPSLCSMRWRAETLGETVFLLGALIVFLVMPSVIIPALYVAIYRKVKSSSVERNIDKRTVNVAKTSVLISGLFVFGWTPYAILAVLDIFAIGYPFNTTWPIILASFTAKLSIILMPTIYLLRHKMFKQ